MNWPASVHLKRTCAAKGTRKVPTKGVVPTATHSATHTTGRRSIPNQPQLKRHSAPADSFGPGPEKLLISRRDPFCEAPCYFSEEAELEPINKRGGIYSPLLLLAVTQYRRRRRRSALHTLRPAYGKPTAGNEGEINGISFCMTRTGKRNGNEKNRAGDIPREEISVVNTRGRPVRGQVRDFNGGF